METKKQNKKTNLRHTQNTPPAKQNNTSVINIIGCKKKKDILPMKWEKDVGKKKKKSENLIVIEKFSSKKSSMKD